MNIWTGIGNLTDDPKISYSTGKDRTAVARFTVAINDNYGKEKKTFFIRCVCFGITAENVEKFLSKGSKVGVTGKIETGSYTNREGQKVNFTEINAREVEFLPKGERTERREERRDVPVGFESVQEEIPWA